MKTVKVRSITNPKVGGKYRLPGTVWQCPVDVLQELLDAGAVELASQDALPARAKLLPLVKDMAKEEIIAELEERVPLFDRSAPVNELREYLTAARQQQSRE